MILLAIDPGASTGWARFDGRTLVACGLTRPADYAATFGPMRPDAAVIERPAIYPGAHNGRDIVTLAARMGRIQAILSCHCEEIEPARWKHQVPKPIHNRRILGALTLDERALAAGAKHDTIDAIGLGLWKLGRML